MVKKNIFLLLLIFSIFIVGCDSSYLIEENNDLNTITLNLNELRELKFTFDKYLGDFNVKIKMIDGEKIPESTKLILKNIDHFKLHDSYVINNKCSLNSNSCINELGEYSPIEKYEKYIDDVTVVIEEYDQKISIDNFKDYVDKKFGEFKNEEKNIKKDYFYSYKSNPFNEFEAIYFVSNNLRIYTKVNGDKYLTTYYIHLKNYSRNLRSHQDNDNNDDKLKIYFETYQILDNLILNYDNTYGKTKKEKIKLYSLKLNEKTLKFNIDEPRINSFSSILIRENYNYNYNEYTYCILKDIKVNQGENEIAFNSSNLYYNKYCKIKKGKRYDITFSNKDKEFYYSTNITANNNNSNDLVQKETLVLGDNESSIITFNDRKINISVIEINELSAIITLDNEKKEILLGTEENFKDNKIYVLLNEIAYSNQNSVKSYIELILNNNKMEDNFHCKKSSFYKNKILGYDDLIPTIKEDYCKNETTLIEFYCGEDDKTINSYSNNCDYGCSNNNCNACSIDENSRLKNKLQLNTDDKYTINSPKNKKYIISIEINSLEEVLLNIEEKTSNYNITKIISVCDIEKIDLGNENLSIQTDTISNNNVKLSYEFQ